MYKINRTIELKERELEIVPFGDVHYGSKGCRIDKLKNLFKWVLSKPNVYLIGMGDYLDCILPTDKRRYEPDEDEAYDNLTALQDGMLEMLRPLKHRIICLLTGNHEYLLKKDGFGDPTCHFSNKLGIRYGGYSAYIKIRIKPKTHQRSLLLWCHHGWFSGRKRGSKVNNLEDNMAYYDADIYLTGHSHDLWATRKSRIHWGGAKDVIFANTGSFLETAKIGTMSYSERANYPPQKLGVVKIKWLPYEDKIYVSE